MNSWVEIKLAVLRWHNYLLIIYKKNEYSTHNI